MDGGRREDWLLQEGLLLEEKGKKKERMNESVESKL